MPVAISTVVILQFAYFVEMNRMRYPLRSFYRTLVSAFALISAG